MILLIYKLKTLHLVIKQKIHFERPTRTAYSYTDFNKQSLYYV